MLTFALASVGSFLAFEWPPLLRKIILTLLLAVIVFRVVRAIGKLLFALSGASGIADQPPSAFESDAARRFWLSRISIIAGFLLFGWAIVSLMPALSFSNEVTRLAAFLFGLGILVTAVEVVWRRPDKPAPLVVKSLLTLYLVSRFGSSGAFFLTRRYRRTVSRAHPNSFSAFYFQVRHGNKNNDLPPWRFLHVAVLFAAHPPRSPTRASASRTQGPDGVAPKRPDMLRFEIAS
nr:hypothetical protein [Sinorhizobium meliloti]